MDSTTLESLLPAVRKGEVSLDGVKIVGELALSSMGTKWQDLSNIETNKSTTQINLDGLDLSGVTSFEGVNLAGADLTRVTLPEDKSLLSQAYGLSSANFPNGVITESIINANQERIANTITDQVAYKAKTKRAKLSTGQELTLRETINELYKDKSVIGERFRAAIENTPNDLISIGFPKSDYSNVADYKGKAAHVLTTIYKNKTTPENIKSTLVSDIMAEEISAQLFGEGARRGQDSLEIRDSIAKAVTKYTKENGLDPTTILDHENILKS